MQRRLKSAKKHLYHGEMLTVREISERSGLTVSSVKSRLGRGTEIESPKYDLKKYEYRGEMLTAVEISEITGLSQATIRRRVADGSPLDAPRKSGGAAPSRLFMFRGEVSTIAQITEALGLSEGTVRQRIARDKPLSNEDGLAVPCDNPDAHLREYRAPTEGRSVLRGWGGL